MEIDCNNATRYIRLKPNGNTNIPKSEKRRNEYKKKCHKMLQRNFNNRNRYYSHSAQKYE